MKRKWREVLFLLVLLFVPLAASSQDSVDITFRYYHTPPGFRRVYLCRGSSMDGTTLHG
ncbi:MAG: hypothetical protein HY708_06845 [Ignavibacteriae bacterium]|nr:hypothetical protein [Ignavibacteriota bacterium]